MMLSAFTINTYAADVNVSATKTGSGSYVVYVSTSYIGRVNLSTSNGQSSSVWCEGGCESRSFSGTGTITITATPENPMSDSNGKDVNASGSSTSISLDEPSDGGGSSGGNSGGGTSGGGSSGGSNSGGSSNSNNNDNSRSDDPSETKATDNTLSSLVTSKGTLNPVFESATLDYKLVLDADVTAITIDATATDTKASVSGTGEKTLKPGDNKLEIIVKAEDGSEKTYTINAYVDEKPDTFMKVNGKDYGVIVNVDDVEAPKGFEKTTLSFNGKEIPAWKNTSTNMMLVYLIDENKDKHFYIYENGEVTSIYKPISILGHDLAIIDIPEDMQNRKSMTYVDVEIDNVKIPGWTFNDESFANYALVYLMNEKGEKVFYQYEKTSNTLQPYSNAAAITQQAYEDLLMMQNYLWIGIGTLGALSLILFILWIRSSKKRKRMDKNDDQSYENRDEYSHEDYPREEFHDLPVVDRTSSIEPEQRPAYHRSRSSQPSEPLRNTNYQENEATEFNTQPFRFQDDFDDRNMK